MAMFPRFTEGLPQLCVIYVSGVEIDKEGDIEAKVRRLIL